MKVVSVRSQWAVASSASPSAPRNSRLLKPWATALSRRRRTHRSRQFLNLVWDAAGGKPKSAGLGRGMQRIIGMFNPVVRELGETRYQRDRAWVVDDRRFRAAFGSTRVTPHAQAVKTTVEWFQANRQAD